MSNILHYFEWIISLQEKHFLLFLLCSTLTTLVGVSLSFQSSKKINCFRFIHLVPLLLSPLLTSKILIDILSSYFSTIRSNHIIIAFFGILFHSWLAFFLLVKVFGLQKRLNDFQFVLKCSKGLKLNSAFILRLFLLKFTRPLIMTIAIIHVFFESMISPCGFTDTGVYSITYTLITYVKVDDIEWLQKIILVFSTVVIFVLYIVLSFCLSKIVEYKMKKELSRSDNDLNRKKSIFNLPSIIIALNKILRGFKYVSLIFQATAILVVLNFIFKILNAQLNSSVINKAINLISITFYSDALKIGSITVLLFAIWLILKISTFNGTAKLLELKHSLLICAIIPSVFYGICGLAISFNKLTYKISEIMSLIVYSFLLFLFFSKWDKLIDQQSLFVNAKRTQQALKNRFFLFLSSRVFNLISAFVITAYFLWFEDGIQYYLGRNNNSNLSSKIRGFKTSSLTNETLLGLIIIFIAVITIIILLKKLENLRFVFINKLYSKIFACLFLLFAFNNSSAEIKSHLIELNCKNETSRITLSDCITLNIQQNCNYEIDSLVIDNNKGDIKIDCGNYTTLTINNLILRGNGALINMTCVSQNELQSMIIKNVMLDDYDNPIIKFSSMNITKLSIDNISCDNPSSGLSIVMNESTVINDLYISNAKLKLLSFFAPNNGTINLYHNQISDLFIQGQNIFYSNGQGIRLIMQQISFVPNYQNQESNLKISNLNFQETNIEIENNNKNQGNLKVLFKNCRLINELNSPDQTNHRVSFKNIRTTLNLDNIIINGRINFDIDAIEDLSFSNIKSDENQDADVICEINTTSDEFPKIALSKIDVSNLTMCVGGKKKVDANFRHVNVKEELLISENILESMNNSNRPSYIRNDFFSLLRSNGKICDQQDYMGTDALYNKKKTDLKRVSRFYAFLIDALTGYGVKISHAFIFFMCYTLLFLIIIMCLLSSRGFGKRLFFAMIYISYPAYPREDEHNRNLINLICHFYHLLIFIQITTLSIYLSQITLQ